MTNIEPQPMGPLPGVERAITPVKPEISRPLEIINKELKPIEFTDFSKEDEASPVELLNPNSEIVEKLVIDLRTSEQEKKALLDELPEKDRVTILFYADDWLSHFGNTQINPERPHDDRWEKWEWSISFKKGQNGKIYLDHRSPPLPLRVEEDYSLQIVPKEEELKQTEGAVKEVAWFDPGDKRSVENLDKYLSIGKKIKGLLDAAEAPVRVAALLKRENIDYEGAQVILFKDYGGYMNSGRGINVQTTPSWEEANVFVVERNGVVVAIVNDTSMEAAYYTGVGTDRKNLTDWKVGNSVKIEKYFKSK